MTLTHRKDARNAKKFIIQINVFAVRILIRDKHYLHQAKKNRVPGARGFVIGIEAD